MIGWLAGAALPLAVLVIALLNVATWRRGRTSVEGKHRVSLLIPARNEEATIARTILSALDVEGDESIAELLVYDDKSTDSTRRIVKRLEQRNPRVRLLSGTSLPEGWVGKPHACSQLADAATGEVLVFVDADVTLKREGLSRLLSLLESPVGGRVVTAVPQQLAVTWAERLVIPLLLLTYLAWLPLRLVEWGRNPRLVAANGQLLAIRKSDYRALGGFEAVKDEIVDDVAFCKHAKSSGQKVVFADGTSMASCRMYESPRAVFEGFSKNLYEGVGGTPGLLVSSFLYFGAFLAPFVLLPLAFWLPDGQPLLLASLVGIGANLAVRAILSLRFRQGWSGLLLHVPSIVTFFYLCINSWLWQNKGAVRWAGRTYARRRERKAANLISSERFELDSSWERSMP